MDGDDDGYVSPVFDLPSDSDDDGTATTYSQNKSKKRRVEAPEEDAVPIDLEALALRALGKR